MFNDLTFIFNAILYKIERVKLEYLHQTISQYIGWDSSYRQFVTALNFNIENVL